MPSHSQDSSHAHHAPHAPGEHPHAPAGGGRATALARSGRPEPAISLLMHSVVMRLLGAAGLAVLIWLAVAWALKDTA